MVECILETVLTATTYSQRRRQDQIIRESGRINKSPVWYGKNPITPV